MPIVRKLLSSWLALAVGLGACSKAVTQQAPAPPVDAPLPVGSARTNAALVERLPPSMPAPPVTSPDRALCPEGMILVDGEYCPNVEQKCLRWMDPPDSRYAYFRCEKYAAPAACKGPRVHKHFCIDATERTEPDSDLPMNKKSWTDATRVCGQAGARLCMTSEWQFACEGEEMRPYPYGWERDASACNVDVMTGLGKVGRLVDHRTPASAHPRCVSAFGVHDMAGNVDEWATVDGAAPGSREVMKGSWWLPGRHACRSFQGGHGAGYGGTESGVRCCTDAHEPETVAGR
jgi:sulfatase modifying factor 1